MTILGSSPPFPARPVSLAVRDYLRAHLGLGEPDSSLNSGLHGVLVGVSGGADSLSLALAAAEHAQHWGVPIVLATVDHSMREGSAEEAHKVREQLLRAGVEDARVLSAAPTDAPRPLEGKARQVRHALLEALAVEWGAENRLATVDILVGHTMDDQAETVLMRLGRGASPRALAAMRPRTRLSRGGAHFPEKGRREAPELFRGRPLLDLRRTDTEGFCRALGLSWVEDPTNTLEGSWTTAGGEPLVRSALRHSVLPRLGEALGQDPVPALARVAAMLGADEDALAWHAQTSYERALAAGQGAKTGDVKIEGEGEGDRASALELNVAELQRLPEAIRTRVYLLAWQKLTKGTYEEGALPQGAHPTFAQVAAVDALVTRDVAGRLCPVGKEVRLPGVKVARSRWQLLLTPVLEPFFG